MATDLTYYLAERDPGGQLDDRGVMSSCAGAHAGDLSLCTVLREAFRRLAGEVAHLRVDGVSVWVDDARKVQLRLVMGGVASPISDSVVTSSAVERLMALGVEVGG